MNSDKTPKKSCAITLHKNSVFRVQDIFNHKFQWISTNVFISTSCTLIKI